MESLEGAALAQPGVVLLEGRTILVRTDRLAGDGDLGTVLARGARAWRDDPARGSSAVQLRRLSALVRRDVGGTSGPLYAAGLLAAAEHLESGADWAGALRAGSDAVRERGGAEPDDCTMVDALAPAAEVAGEGLDAVVAAAERGSERTAELTARRGRTSYLGDWAHGHPDPGGVAVLTWLRALRDVG